MSLSRYFCHHPESQGSQYLSLFLTRLFLPERAPRPQFSSLSPGGYLRLELRPECLLKDSRMALLGMQSVVRPNTTNGRNFYSARPVSCYGGWHLATTCRVSHMSLWMRCGFQALLPSKFSHFLVSKVHERSVDGDLLMLQLKELMTQHKKLKVILMSATINHEIFVKYFDNAPLLTIPGSTHPVRDV